MIRSQAQEPEHENSFLTYRHLCTVKETLIQFLHADNNMQLT